MRVFCDRSGREWTVDITVLTVERVKAACGIDMPALFAERMAGLDALLADQIRFLKVVFECCRPAAEKAGLTIEHLQAEWNGETADAAGEAWMEELVNFFPDARKREALRTAVKTLREMGARIAEKAVAEMTPEAMEKDLEKVFSVLRLQFSQSRSNDSSGSMPAISDSIPALSPSDSST